MKRGLILLTTLTLVIVLSIGCNGVPSAPAVTSPKATPQTLPQTDKEFNFRLLISDEVNVIDRFNSVNVTWRLWELVWVLVLLLPHIP